MPSPQSVKGYLSELKLTHTWQLRTMADKGRLLTDSTVKSRTVVEFASAW